jgi:hypothetical protein
MRFTSWGDRLLGEVQYLQVNLPLSAWPVPAERTIAWRDDSEWGRALTQKWADRPLEPWAGEGRGAAPRILLARLLGAHDLAGANLYLQGLQPWGRPGSSWALHPEGNYDFALIIFTTLLWRFGDQPETLWPATREHLLTTLLTVEGGRFQAKVPRSLGMVSETENHLLMTEGSRYLKNRWLVQHERGKTEHDNRSNGQEARLLELLRTLRREGLYEFNSQPYIAYTLTALLNLEAFGDGAVQTESRALLDELNFTYALGSYGLRHFGPFRRRVENARRTSLTEGYQTAFFTAWLHFREDPTWDPPDLASSGEAHALMATSLPYRPPDAVVRLLHDKGDGYLAQLGHGPLGSPEIYAAGPGYLFSAGGVTRGARSLLVARPTVLLLADGATDLAEVFHLAGPGDDFTAWNNTGVHRDFAVAAGPVRVPASAVLLEEQQGWRAYAGPGGRNVAVYSGAGFSLLVVVSSLRLLLAMNQNPAALAQRFCFPDGRVLTYDVAAPLDQWIIKTVNGVAVNRAFDGWPRWQVEGWTR